MILNQIVNAISNNHGRNCLFVVFGGVDGPVDESMSEEVVKRTDAVSIQCVWFGQRSLK